MAIANGTCVSLSAISLRHILASPGYAPGTIAVNVTWMLVKRIAAYTHLHYLQPFTSYSEILVGNCNVFLPPSFNASVGGVPIGIPGKRLVPRKLESLGYQAVKTV